MDFVKAVLNYSMDFVKAVDYDQVNFEDYVTSFLLEPYRLMLCGMTLVLLSLRASSLMIQEMNIKNVKKESKLRVGHLSYGRRRRWNGNLRARFESRLQLKSLAFLMLWSSVNAMDAEQTRQLQP